MILPVVAVALWRGDGRILMQRRPEGKQHGGLWEFPGGKIDPGEGAADAALREMDEELGIGLSRDDLIPISFAEQAGGRRILLLLYAAQVWRGEPVAREGQHFEWLAPGDLLMLEMPPLDVPLAAALLQWIGGQAGGHGACG